MIIYQKISLFFDVSQINCNKEGCGGKNKQVQTYSSSTP